MKKAFFGLVIFMCCLLSVGLLVKGESLSISAQSGILMESHSGRVLYEKNIHLQRPVASISKIMTAIIAIENGNLDEYVTISKQATLQVGSSLYVQEGDKVKLRDLVYGLLLRSGNDAAYAIAEYIGEGDVNQFVLMMNELAKEIGMKNSTFENPSGLDETTKNISTAYDMALLTKYAMNNPIYREINDTKSHRAITFNKQVYLWRNKHRLINSHDYVIGGKTGFTKLARRTLVTVAKRDDMELIVVTLDDPNDWHDHMNLFNYGFKEYEMMTLIRKGIFEVKPLDKIFYVDENINYPFSSNEFNQYKFIVEVDETDKKTYLMLVKDKSVVLKREIHEYDTSHSVLKNSFTIYDFGVRVMEFIRDMFW